MKSVSSPAQSSWTWLSSVKRVTSTAHSSWTWLSSVKSVTRTAQYHWTWRVDSHFLEEVPVGDDLELLEDEEDATADEEGLVLGQGLVQQQQVALTVTETERQKSEKEGQEGSRGRERRKRDGKERAGGDTHLTAFVTSANCMRSYFLSSW